MKAIGGYFELEQGQSEGELHGGAIRLNSGRAALEYLIRSGDYRFVFLPQYCCAVLADRVRQAGAAVIPYDVDDRLEIRGLEKSVSDDTLFVYVNYFGLQDKYIASLVMNMPNLVIDNVHAFYAAHIPGTASFNSARKFFGVPDGAYLYPFDEKRIELEEDFSEDRTAHLLKRLQNSPEEGYTDFLVNEAKIGALPLRNMSALTRSLLSKLDYESIKIRRRENFKYLATELHGRNGFIVHLNDEVIPMAYPFLTDDKSLRKKMIQQRIFVPTFWPELKNITTKKSIAYRYTEYLLPLPIDQRLDKNDLDRILELIA